MVAGDKTEIGFYGGVIITKHPDNTGKKGEVKQETGELVSYYFCHGKSQLPKKPTQLRCRRAS